MRKTISLGSVRHFVVRLEPTLGKVFKPGNNRVGGKISKGIEEYSPLQVPRFILWYTSSNELLESFVFDVGGGREKGRRGT